MFGLQAFGIEPVCVFGPIKNENGDETEKLRKKSPVRISKTAGFDRTTFLGQQFRPRGRPDDVLCFQVSLSTRFLWSPISDGKNVF